MLSNVRRLFGGRDARSSWGGDKESVDQSGSGGRGGDGWSGSGGRVRNRLSRGSRGGNHYRHTTDSFQAHGSSSWYGATVPEAEACDEWPAREYGHASFMSTTAGRSRLFGYSVEGFSGRDDSEPENDGYHIRLGFHPRRHVKRHDQSNHDHDRDGDDSDGDGDSASFGGSASASDPSQSQSQFSRPASTFDHDLTNDRGASFSPPSPPFLPAGPDPDRDLPMDMDIPTDCFDSEVRPGHSRWCKCPTPMAQAARADRQRCILATAHPQGGADIFARLPREIRAMILEELWIACGYQHGLHVCFDVAGRRFYQCRCITDPDEGAVKVKKRSSTAWGDGSNWRAVVGRDGLREEEDSSDDDDDDGVEAEPNSPHLAWTTNFASVWFNHWKCDALAEKEKSVSAREGTTSPFLPVLLTCKRFYMEGLESIFQSLTFTFHNRWVPLKFFAHRPHPALRLIRRVHLTINFWNGGFSEWECLWANLAELDGLREIRVWLNQEPMAVASAVPQQLQFQNAIGASDSSQHQQQAGTGAGTATAGEVTVTDILDIIGADLAGKVVFDIPIVKSTNPYHRRYNLEGAPFGVRWHKRGPLTFGS